MNDAQNEKRLIPIRKIILYTFIVGVILMILAYVSGILSFGTNPDDHRFGVDDEPVENRSGNTP